MEVMFPEAQEKVSMLRGRDSRTDAWMMGVVGLGGFYRGADLSEVLIGSQGSSTG